MSNDWRAHWIRSGLTLLIGAALAIAAGAAHADNHLPVADGVTVPTQEQCQGAWDGSSASDSCGAGVVSYVHGSLDAATVTVWTTVAWRWHDGDEQQYIAAAGCRVQVQCMRTGTDADQTVRDNKGVANDWSGSLEDAGDLQNCDGTMSVGSTC